MNLTGMNDSCLPYDPYQDNTRIFKIITIITLSIFGFLGNTLVITLAAKFTARKNLHYLIINMSVADIMVVVITGPPSLTVYWNYDLWVIPDKWDDIACKSFAFLRLVATFISFNSLLIISIERCRATRRTVHRSKPNTLMRRIMVLILSWVGSFAVASHAFSVFKIVTSSTSFFKCLPDFGGKNVFWILLGKLCLVVAMFLSMVFINLVTLRHLSIRQPIEDHLSEAQRIDRSRQTRKIVIMILCSVMMCFLCYLPFTTISLITAIHQKYTGNDFLCFDSIAEIYVFVVTFFLPLLNSFISPCIYLIFLSDFRQAAAKFILICGANNEPTNKTYPEQNETTAM